MRSRTIFPPRGSQRFLALAGVVATLAGCASAPNAPPSLARNTEAPNPIEVSVTHRSLAVHFDPGEIAPKPKDVAALNVLMATDDIKSGDAVRIERAASVLADARARALASALARQGLKPTLAAPGGAPDGELRLVVEHAVATAPRCPNWTKPPGNDFENTLHSDFGCASAIDLAAMVADPRDLVEGRPLAPMIGDAALWPMERYRNGAPERSDQVAPQPWVGSTTFMATAPTKAQAAPGASDKPPVGAAATAASNVAPAGTSALQGQIPGAPQ